MKKNYKWLINIAAICLCICAMAIGIYAAKQASLTATGTIGFTAHNCKLNVETNILAAKTANATERSTATIAAQEISGEDSIDLDSAYTTEGEGMYFSDLATDGDKIEVTFKIENLSAFKVTVKPGSVTLDGVDVTTSWSISQVDLEQLQGTEADGQGTDFATITLTITLNNMDTATSFDAKSLSINIQVDEYSQYYVDSTTKMLTTKMGHGTEAEGAADVAIEWVAFAVKGEGDTYEKPSFVTSTLDAHTPSGTTEKWYSLKGADMTNVDYKGYTFWFVQKYVTAGGYNNIEGHVFNESGNGSNYTGSAIETYILGDYLKDTGILDNEGNVSDELYDSITKRSVTETYDVSGTSQTLTMTNAGLWLLSIEELSLLEGKTFTGYGYVTSVYGISAQDTFGTWCLRSPGTSMAGWIHGTVQEMSSCLMSNLMGITTKYGIRAAFEITI